MYGHEICATLLYFVTKLCVPIFQAMGCNISINDIDIAHRAPARNATN